MIAISSPAIGVGFIQKERAYKDKDQFDANSEDGVSKLLSSSRRNYKSIKLDRLDSYQDPKAEMANFDVSRKTSKEM